MEKQSRGVTKKVHLNPKAHEFIYIEDEITLPNNKKFNKDENYKEDYTKFMDQMMKKGHAEKVSPDEESVVDFKSWYIRHHGVYHRKKPEKIRVVFGCLSEYKGESINMHLLQGLDLTNKLIGVLTRFRCNGKNGEKSCIT